MSEKRLLNYPNVLAVNLFMLTLIIINKYYFSVKAHQVTLD